MFGFLKRKLIWCVPEDMPELAPQRATEGSLGYDLRTPIEFELPPATPNGVGKKLINTMIVAIPPKSHGLLLVSKSGLASKGITVEAGLLDNDFRGFIQVLLYNHTGNTFKFNKLDKIAQVVVVPLIKTQIKYSSKYPDVNSTKRGAGGFGSTGSN